MPFDGLLMYRLAKEIKANLPMTIINISRISDTDIFLVGRSDKRELGLIISLHLRVI